MINFIKTLIQLYKVINFTNRGLVISYAGSKIMLTNRGDIIINSKRHTIHHRDLFFDGCDQDFIDKAIDKNEKGKRHLEKFVLGGTAASEYVNVCNVEKEKEKHGNGN